MPQTRWGFHQLRDSEARRLVRAAATAPGHLVVDLGAGTGRLTNHLLAAGAHVIAVELHPGRAALLRRRFADTDCRVLCTDIAEWRPPTQPFRVVANPPYAVVTTVLRRLVARHSRLIRADLVVPYYVAARWSRGAIPARWNAGGYTIRRARILAPSAFQPAAPGRAAVIVVERTPSR